MFKYGCQALPILSLIAAAAIGCSSAEPPLSIRMYNPETGQQLNCSARDQNHRSDASLLARAVENCAKTLEANGFVRQN